MVPSSWCSIKGLAEKALRAINPAEARDEGDVAAREARAKKILGEMFKGEQIESKNIVPGLGERWVVRWNIGSQSKVLTRVFQLLRKKSCAASPFEWKVLSSNHRRKLSVTLPTKKVWVI